jgi:REP element-mobilizing transposase RayT
MVTFMLTDSFPVHRRAEWETIMNEANDSTKRRQLEAWIDRGHGECWLKQPDLIDIVEGCLRDGHGHDYELLAWVIIPNHVHLIVKIHNVPLAKLVNLWKGKSARQSNRALGRNGRFWNDDHFDTLIRDSEHLSRAIRYIEQNPMKAKLIRDPKEWRGSSARLRDEFGRLQCATTEHCHKRPETKR